VVASLIYVFDFEKAKVEKKNANGEDVEEMVESLCAALPANFAGNPLGSVGALGEISTGIPSELHWMTQLNSTGHPSEIFGGAVTYAPVTPQVNLLV
jgi:hypothetical protein